MSDVRPPSHPSGEAEDERLARARALLERGYPHALDVAPEDLELLRSRQRLQSVPARVIATGLAVASFGEGVLGLGLAVSSVPRGAGLIVSLLAVAVMLASASMVRFLWSATPRTSLRWAGLTLLAAYALPAIWLGVLENGYASIVFLLAAPVAISGAVALALSATLRPAMAK